MAIIGSPKEFLEIEDFIPKILAMVLDAWSSFEKPLPNKHEVPITRKFRLKLLQHRDLNGLPLKIEREVSIDDPETGEEIGRIDLCLTCDHRSEVYFAFECMRLNVIDKNGRTSTLAKEYVMNGMTRFVGSNPQYAIGLKQGGMIGYVMNGKIDGAITAVNQQIKDHYKDLQMKPSKGLNPSSRLPENLIRESLHHIPDRDFTIHHVFLPISTI